MERLKQKIINNVNIDDTTEIKGTNLLDYANLMEKRIITIESQDTAQTFEAEIWTKAIQMALDENKNVYIPDMGHEIYIDKSIIMRSGYNLCAEKTQTIGLVPDSSVCMIRNENIFSGAEREVSLNEPDVHITVSGGIWTTYSYSSEHSNGNWKCYADSENSIQGVLAIMLFCNVRHLIIKNAVFCDSMSYAVQISNCSGFYVDNIEFINYHKDGIHVNGPAQYGIIKNLSGENMGDDMVALNAWDWYTSAATFGTIEYVLVDNIESNHNEIRLLPGRKIFADSSFIDCDINDCIFENIRGVYTFKLYCQPNIANAIRGINDTSGTVGNMRNLYFSNIVFPKVLKSGLNDLPVCGLFDICADCKDLYFRDIKIEDTDFINYGSHLIKAGPLSATWKNGSDAPEDWGEVFSPDDICCVDGVCINNVFCKKSNGEYEIISDETVLAKETCQTVNKDYPNTTPKGGTGYGIIKNIKINS